MTIKKLIFGNQIETSFFIKSEVKLNRIKTVNIAVLSAYIEMDFDIG